MDIGVVYANEKNRTCRHSKTAREIDFIAGKGNQKVYLQSAFALPDDAKTEQKLKPLSLTNDSFPKIIVRRDLRRHWYNEDGVLPIGLIDFLLNDGVV